MYTSFGLDHGVGHPVPFDLPHGSPRRTERSRGDVDRIQYCRKHRARFLSEESLRRRRLIGSREQEVAYCGQTGPLSGMVQASQLMVPQ